jgi:hypothetical protein
MKSRKIGSLALCATLCVAAGALAQGGMGRHGGPPQGGRMYDPKTVETISGQVLSVEQVRGKGQGRAGGGYGVHVILKSDAGEIAVHLGPSWFLDQQGLKVAQGDQIEVRGSRITFDGKPAIIAAQVKKGSQSVTLRDDNGLPAWRGQGRRAP